MHDKHDIWSGTNPPEFGVGMLMQIMSPKWLGSGPDPKSGWKSTSVQKNLSNLFDCQATSDSDCHIKSDTQFTRRTATLIIQHTKQSSDNSLTANFPHPIPSVGLQVHASNSHQDS